MARFNWTQEMRRLVFQRLLAEFGPYATWPTGPRGGDALVPVGREAQFESALRELSVALGGDAAQWTAVQQQVRWALTRQARITHQNHFRIMVMNKAAALEVGFLRYRDMPTAAELTFDQAVPDEGDADPD